MEATFHIFNHLHAWAEAHRAAPRVAHFLALDCAFTPVNIIDVVNLHINIWYRFWSVLVAGFTWLLLYEISSRDQWCQSLSLSSLRLAKAKSNFIGGLSELLNLLLKRGLVLLLPVTAQRNSYALNSRIECARRLDARIRCSVLVKIAPDCRWHIFYGLCASSVQRKLWVFYWRKICCFS